LIYRYALGGNYFSIETKIVGDEPRAISSSFEKNVFAILLVCRQTYADSVLLPFQLSSFKFDYAWDFKAWCNGLNPIQRDAVETIAFGIAPTFTCMTGLGDIYCVETFRKLRNLSSLKEVIFYDMVHWDIFEDQLVNHVREAARKKDLRVTLEEL
jgi:hypothetical protein